ncbi:tail fiber assembly protein [Pseudomonas sp. FP1742]|uniref:tail fiber assembly protein n=1 Tax=Pseudomonas sp. FP1742 TaxID=2954079 RepID=UPI0027342140|nr:tail fiber assembly protein [Pseudomonas sp. FP1742]WLG49098.1 tail fiber assembly protein [Pseudomonas sp. FP1742]
MRTFARIDAGVVMEFFPTPGYPQEQIPEGGDIRSLFHPDVHWVEITGADPAPAVGWSYSDGSFSEPAPYVPSAAEIHATNSAIRDNMLDAATRAIAPLQDAVDLGEVTDSEQASLISWKQFRVAANRVDLTHQTPEWPLPPEIQG